MNEADRMQHACQLAPLSPVAHCPTNGVFEAALLRASGIKRGARRKARTEVYRYYLVRQTIFLDFWSKRECFRNVGKSLLWNATC